MPTIHEHHPTTKRHMWRWPTVTAFGLTAALLALPGAAAASDPAECYPLAADVGSIVAPSTALPRETVEAMTAPVECLAADGVDIAWPVEADLGSIV